MFVMVIVPLNLVVCTGTFIATDKLALVGSWDVAVATKAAASVEQSVS
jgi:hypothetical protein